MYVKKSFRLINSPQKKNIRSKLQIKVIDFILHEQHRFTNGAIPIYYIIYNLSEDEVEVYQSIHKLVYQNKLEKIFFSICPVCGYENMLKEEYGKAKCQYCTEVYYSDDIEEKYKLLQE
ncbi:MAG: hypothetical protein KZY61_00985 [Clostridiaceae bacterium]|nr:hypothetical protein [Clostridiaceae bacterium]MBW4860323.1 hypothetical protein [Clostridiaceae bacterium]MBW4867230.1 hypothetical protein [Clostridiaceae bacterium]